MKNFKLYLLLILICVSLSACSKGSSKKEETTKSTKKAETSISTTNEEKTAKEVAVKATEGKIKEVTEKASPDYSGVAKKTKDFILNGQKDIAENKKINWNETFLNKLNMTALYKNYLSDGGKEDNTKSFAQYLTKYAPIPSDWKNLTNNAILNIYDKKISYTKHLDGDLYQVYVEIDGSDVPLVVVNCRTGYFHG